MFQIKDKNSHSKLWIYFTLLFFLPGIILGFLAYRGIQNDQAIIEKQKRVELQRLGDEIINSLRAHLDSLAIYLEYADYPLDQALNREDSIYVIQNILSFTEGKPIWVLPTYDQDVNNIEQISTYNPQGAKLEFQDKNFEKAIQFYQSLLSRSESPAAKASYYLTICRLLEKSGNKQAAIKIYKELNDSFSSFPAVNTMPMGWIAQNKLIELHVDLGLIENAVEEIFALGQNILQYKWSMDFEDFQYLIDRSTEIISAIASTENSPLSSPIKDSLLITQNLLADQKDFTLYLRTFRKDINQYIPDPNKQERSYQEIGNHKFLYETILKEGAPLLILYDLNAFREWGLQHLRSKEELASFSVFENSEFPTSHQMDSTGTVYHLVSLPVDLPTWTIVLAKEPSSLWLGFIDFNQGIFIYIFIFIVFILILGFYLLTKTINAELQLSNLKSDFIASVSHEFKSPITAIRQLSERLSENKVNSEDKKQQYYQALHSQSVRLSHLVDNILDFARLESGEKMFTFQLTDLNDLILKTVDTFKKSILQSPFPVSLDLAGDLPQVLIDQSSFSQVLENLLDNAYKYAFSEKGVQISTTVNSSHVLLGIKDFGPGIPKDHMNRVFDRFYRVPNESMNQVKGSGIGLSLVKKIIEAHGARINLESRINNGTEFIINIPLNPQDHEN